MIYTGNEFASTDGYVFEVASTGTILILQHLIVQLNKSIQLNSIDKVMINFFS